MNPLIEKSKLEHEAIPFDKIKAEHFLPALEEAITHAKSEYEKIKEEKEISFKTIVERAEEAESTLDQIVNVFYALYGAECTEEINNISQKFSETLTKYSSDITLDKKLFAQVQRLYEQRDSMNLNPEQLIILDDMYKGFARNGALLDEQGKTRLREIDEKLSSVGLKFSENVRKATNEYVLFVEDENKLKGMPDSVLEQARETAKEKGKENAWAFTLQFPSYLPFMQYCQDRELRKEIFMAASVKAVEGEFGNQDNIKETLKLRHDRARLLGYDDHAHYTLEKRMAQDAKTVMSFLENILGKARPAATREFEKLKDLKHELTGEDREDFHKYDGPFYTEILKKRELNIDDELLRPYFKLENVIDGVFEVANRLYGINFKEVDVPVYHKDVKAFEVTDDKGKFVGLFYADFFPRDAKRPGAWMTDLRAQGLQHGKVKRPFVAIVCNFTKPTASKPSLLTLDEVMTLFHEFGHSLHGLLSNVHYRAKSGTSVYWDFVELPSQIMENWVMEKECLDIFAKHYETGEKIPQEYVDKIRESQTFLEGMGTLRQLSFAFLDMAFHTADPSDVKDVVKFEHKVMEDYDLYPRVERQNMAASFGHIFAGGYAAGYYSYKWAEVLDADAFEAFKEQGIFNQEVAKKFKENILEKGGSDHPATLYQNFRGKDADPEALLRRAGLI
ncbi:MAG: M3 family metallopeptidase [Bacteriovoracaceae bacterium]|nr:M3 family metallopeptidase [Bacteriovoracaceae bacterium]